MLKLIPNSFKSSNNLNISSSLIELPHSPSKAKDSSQRMVSYSPYSNSNQYFLQENTLSNNSQNKTTLLSLPAQTDAHIASYSHLSTMTTTNPSQPKSSISSKSSMMPQFNTLSSFKNKIVEIYEKDENSKGDQFPICNGENVKSNLSDLDNSLSFIKSTKNQYDECEIPAQREQNDKSEFDSIKRTFDDLMKRKSAKEQILKQQIENNKRSLLEKFLKNSNIGIISNSNNNNNAISNDNCNIAISNDKNDKEKPLSTISEKFNEEVKSSQNEIVNLNSNSNNYYNIKDKYKQDRKKGKTKSSIFKSEDLRVSKTDTINLNQSDNKDEKEDTMNLYSPINDNVNINKNNNIIIIQKKLFESGSESVNEYEREVKESIKEYNDFDIFNINDISIKDDIVYIIEKVNNFEIIGVKKQKVKKNNERVSRLLSMQLVEKFDYNSPMPNSNISSINNKKHNKTASNVLSLLNGNVNNKNTQKKVNKKGQVLGNNINSYNNIKSNKKNSTQSQRMSFIEANSFKKMKSNIGVLTKRNNSNGKNLNSYNNNLNYPFSTKNKPISLRSNRPTSAKQKTKETNINNVIESISTNQKIKFNKSEHQIEAIVKLKNASEYESESERQFMILVEKAKENYLFKGVYGVSKNKKNANKFYALQNCPSIITLNLYEIYIEDEKRNFYKVQSISNNCIQTLLALKKK